MAIFLLKTDSINRLIEAKTCLPRSNINFWQSKTRGTWHLQETVRNVVLEYSLKFL